MWRIILKHKHYKQRRGNIKMQVNTILSDDMTLDEKLAAIDAAIAEIQQKATNDKTTTSIDVPFDPADLTICVGCQ